MTTRLTYEENLISFLEKAEKAPWLVIDYETDGKDVRQALYGTSHMTVLGVSFTYPLASGTLASEYISFGHFDYKCPEQIQKRTKYIINTHPRVIVFSMKMELAVSEYLGCPITGKVYCVQMMSHYIDQGHFEYSLDRVSKDYDGKPKNRSEEMNKVIKGLGWGFIPFNMMREYAVNDTVITYELFKKLYPRFCAMGFEGELWDREIAKAKVLIKMESIGLLVDRDFVESEIKIGEARMAEIVQALQGRNPKSPKDCHYLLIEKLGLPVLGHTDGGKPSFKKEIMQKYDLLIASKAAEWKDPTLIQTAKLITEFRGWQTAISLIYHGCLNNISSDGRVRCVFKPWGTNTSRLSAEYPNPQQLPKTSNKRWNGNAKKAYIPTPGYDLWEFDYDQLELRVSASISKEEKLIQIFKDLKADPNSIDFFTSLSKVLGLERDPTKTFVYSNAYGAGIVKIAGSLGISEARAEKIRKDFQEEYKNIYKLAKRAVLTFRKNGYIKLWTGRRISKSRFSGGAKDFAAFNYLIQGSGAEIVTTQMIRIDELIDWDSCRMVLQVHDSLVFEIKKGTEDKWIPLIKDIMEDVSFAKTEVPFTVSHKRWGTKG